MAGTGELRQLRRRIRSVKSTQQITRAMEMIAASRIQRAQRRVEESRPYAEMIHEIIRGLVASNEVREHPLLSPHDTIDTVGIIVVTSDRGLAGAYNANIFRRTEALIREQIDGRDLALYLTGRKAVSYFRFQGRPAERTWTGFSERPDIADATNIADAVMQDYAEGDLDRVFIVYTDFRSQMSQSPTAVQILPVDVEEFEGGEELSAEFMYEPAPEDILDRLIPRYVEAKVYAALLESAASEHAMRQRAMASASDNAEDVVTDLSRELNQARQAQITQEISEIVGGAEALSESRDTQSVSV